MLEAHKNRIASKDTASVATQQSVASCTREQTQQMNDHYIRLQSQWKEYIRALKKAVTEAVRVSKRDGTPVVVDSLILGHFAIILESSKRQLVY